MRVVVLLGGSSEEREVSLASGCQVADALRQSGHDVVALDPSHGALTHADEADILATGVRALPPGEIHDAGGAGSALTTRDEILAAHRRMQQEFDDSRGRLNRDFEVRVTQAKASTFRRLLEIADHMDRALEAAGASGASESEAGLTEGVRLIHRELLAALRDEGVERMEVVGRPFDPEVAEAMAVVEVDDPGQHDVVVREMRPGYRLGDLTVRPAQVQVGRCPAKRKAQGDGGQAGS